MDSVKAHRRCGGKIEIMPKCDVKSYDDFAVWYTPGVAEACRAITEDRAEAFELTNRWNTIAIVTDGTRVLGLGNIGAEAALPVMEGKALLFKCLGGVDAVPLCLNGNVEEVVRAIAPTFGGINLEDIESPRCFSLLEKLRSTLDTPVWHDDQQGTATAVVAGLINALKVAGKRAEEVKVVLVGAGAAGIAIERLLPQMGIKEGSIIVVDSKGIISRERKDLEEYKKELCDRTNAEGLYGGLEKAVKGADAIIAASAPGAIREEHIKLMKDKAIVFATANPVPEIEPEKARGAFIMATGRSDFENQVNNSLVFPAVFRGVLDVRAKRITDSMCIAAANALAESVGERLSEHYIIPRMDETAPFVREATAVGMEAIKEGIAGLNYRYEDLYAVCKERIENARERCMGKRT
ncbi:MAG: NADP-dependent malic enzyme [Candidatus Thermoplasmatota archaeon]|nr:NADP-dependent malic enzyme [Candidatus Thermoplasmatota archaeon]